MPRRVRAPVSAAPTRLAPFVGVARPRRAIDGDARVARDALERVGARASMRATRARRARATRGDDDVGCEWDDARERPERRAVGRAGGAARGRSDARDRRRARHRARGRRRARHGGGAVPEVVWVIFRERASGGARSRRDTDARCGRRAIGGGFDRNAGTSEGF